MNDLLVSVTLVVGLAAAASACAPRVAPAPPPVAPRYPGFVYPAVPPELAVGPAPDSHQRAWQLLQAGDLRGAERSFETLLSGNPAFYPAEAGLGYVNLARANHAAAVERFSRALDRGAAYLPALIGRGEALLAADRGAEALDSFEAALVVDPSLADIRRRVDVLRFRIVQESVDVARRAARDGRADEARDHYTRALAASPDSALLWRELGTLERRAGHFDRALEFARKAADLDPADSRARVLVGEIHEARGDFRAAIDAYSEAATIEPGDEIAARLAAVRERADLAALPEAYRRIAVSPAISRADLAALIGVRLSPVVRAAGSRQSVVITDTRDHWAASWIMAVTTAGLMEVYANHTFEPGSIVRRGELGQVVSGVLAVLENRDRQLARRWQTIPTRFADLGPGHLAFAAAARAVAAGVLALVDGETFQLNRVVTGAEAVQAIGQLEALARQARPALP